MKNLLVCEPATKVAVNKGASNRESLSRQGGIHSQVTSLILIIIFISLFSTNAVAEEELTKGDAAALISGTDFVKRKIGDLFSWTIGYDLSKVSQVKLVPTIKYIVATPKRLPPNGVTVLDLSAAVEDPNGLMDISGVRADLSSIGKLPNSMLVDNGLWGDKTPNDGIYALQSNVDPAISLGDKEIPVAVANKKGWLAISKTSIIIDNSPQIVKASVTPSIVKADAQTITKILVKIEPPGPQGEIRSVYANLKDIGLGEHVGLQYRGNLTFTIDTVVPIFIRPGVKTLQVTAENVLGQKDETDLVLEVVQ